MSNNNNNIMARYNPANHELPFVTSTSTPPYMPSSPPNNAGYVLNDSDGETGTPPVQLPPNGLRLEQLQEGRTYKLVGSFLMSSVNATRGVSGNPHLPLHEDLVDFQTIGLRMRDRSPIFGSSGQTEYTVTFENFAKTFAVGQEDLAPESYFIDMNRNTPTTQSTLTPLTMNSTPSPQVIPMTPMPNAPLVLRANSPPPPAPAYEYPPESPVPNYNSNTNKPKTKVNTKMRGRMMGGKRKTKKGKKSRKGKSRRHRKY